MKKSSCGIFPFFVFLVATLQQYGCHAFVVHNGQPVPPLQSRTAVERVDLTALAATASNKKYTAPCSNNSRRDILVGGSTSLAGILLAAATAATVSPPAAWAAFILDEETGEYVETEDVPWQQAWKERLDKASTMSKDEIFQAARGAGNVDLKQGEESQASRKRRYVTLKRCEYSCVQIFFWRENHPSYPVVRIKLTSLSFFFPYLPLLHSCFYRAMSACRDGALRSKVGAGTEIECTKRVFSGEVEFLLEAL